MRTRPARGGPPATAPGERIYAIGDVHGRHDLLVELIDRINDHSDARGPAAAMHVVLLGDLVDRGPATRETLAYVRAIQQADDRLIVLPGNHEDVMLRALDGEAGMLRTWLRIGGRATLRSFGIEPPDQDADAREFARTAGAAIPPGLLDWLRALPLSARSGDYFFCHAGIRPGVPLKRQTRSDMLWIREAFLDDPADHGSVVVHGHSVAADVDMRDNRIGIDTGAYRTGVLSALYLEGTRREIIATAPAAAS